MHRTNIYLEEQQTAELDRLAADLGVSRAEAIRRLLAEGLEGRTRDVTVDLTWIEASFGVATDIEGPDRGPGARQEHLDQLRAD